VISCGLLAKHERDQPITVKVTSMVYFCTELWTTIPLAVKLPRLGQKWDKWQKTAISFCYFGQSLTLKQKKKNVII
jgi:hypothetical protein